MRRGVVRKLRSCACPLALAVAAAAHAGQGDLSIADRVERVEATCAEALEAAGPVERRAHRERIERTVERALDRSVVAAAEFDAGRPGAAGRRIAHATRTARRARSLARRALRRLDAGPERWHVVLRDLTATLYSVWTGEGPDPWVVATGADDGRGPLFLRGRGEGFVRIPAAAHGDLWWVDEVPGAGLFACGTEGSVVRYDVATGATAAIPTGAAGTLYGIWGASGDEVWSVGVGPGDERPLLLRFDGAEWRRVAPPAGSNADALYKIWGRSRDDVWACGSRGTLLHYDGNDWKVVPTGIESTLLTVHRGVAVGEVFTATLVGRGAGFGGGWGRVPVPPAARSLAGVFVPAAEGPGRGDAWAVGYFGTVLRREDGTWRREGEAPVPEGLDLHAVRTDATGAVWMAGGDIFGRGQGLLLHRGPRTPGGDVLPSSSYEPEVLAALDASCGGCHATQPTLDVHPGRPSLGGLARVLAGDHPGGAPAVAAADLDVLRAWIVGGALRD